MKDTDQIKVGSLVEADVIGTPGTFRVIEAPFAPREGHTWIRETGLHICKGYEPFVIDWPIDQIRVVEGA